MVLSVDHAKSVNGDTEWVKPHYVVNTLVETTVARTPKAPSHASQVPDTPVIDQFRGTVESGRMLGSKLPPAESRSYVLLKLSDVAGHWSTPS